MLISSAPPAMNGRQGGETVLSDSTLAGIYFLGFSIPIWFLVWHNQKTGSSAIHWGARPIDRRSSPARFWAIQAALGFFGVATLAVGALVVTGLAHP
jgi:hypothetical protein